MPSRAGQEELLLRLHRDIGVDPNETSFVEVRQCPSLFEAIRRLSLSKSYEKYVRQAKFWNRVMGLEHRLGKRSLTWAPGSTPGLHAKRPGIQSMPAPFRQWPQVADLPPIHCISDQ